MTRSLILKALPIVIAVVLLQLAFAPESQAQGGYGGGGFYYTVQYGDTLFAICRRFGVDPYQIAQVNGLPNADYIYAGQVLYIPPSSGYCPQCQYNQPHPQPYPSHEQQGCGNNCYQQSHGQGCGNNCYQQSHGQGCGNNCYQQSHWQGCGNNCYQQGSGYDYTGYYYDYNSGNQQGYYPNYQRYSYTCGYNYNCY
jgi:LysM repeat protein